MSEFEEFYRKNKSRRRVDSRIFVERVDGGKRKNKKPYKRNQYKYRPGVDEFLGD